jgi:hypothetical protein
LKRGITLVSILFLGLLIFPLVFGASIECTPTGDPWIINKTVVCEGATLDISTGIWINRSTPDDELDVSEFTSSSMAVYDLSQNESTISASVPDLIDDEAEYTADWDSNDSMIFKIMMQEADNEVQIFANFTSADTQYYYTINVDGNSSTGSSGMDVLIGRIDALELYGGIYIFNSSLDQPAALGGTGWFQMAQSGQIVNNTIDENLTTTYIIYNNSSSFAYELVIDASGSWEDKLIYAAVAGQSSLGTTFKNTSALDYDDASFTLIDSTLNLEGNLNLSDNGNLTIQNSTVIFDLTANGSANLSLDSESSYVSINDSNLTSNGTYYFGVDWSAAYFNLTNSFVTQGGLESIEMDSELSGTVDALIYNNTFTRTGFDLQTGGSLDTLRTWNISANNFTVGVPYFVTGVGNLTVYLAENIFYRTIYFHRDTGGDADITVENNTFYVLGTYPGINLAANGPSGIIFKNNNFIDVGVTDWPILDLNDSAQNTLIYSNQYALVSWTNAVNISVGPDINFGNGDYIEIGSNNITVDLQTELQELNVSMQLEFYNLNWTEGSAQLYLDGVRCDDDVSLCNSSYSYNGTRGTLSANVSSFGETHSDFVTAGTSLPSVGSFEAAITDDSFSSINWSKYYLYSSATGDHAITTSAGNIDFDYSGEVTEGGSQMFALRGNLTGGDFNSSVYVTLLNNSEYLGEETGGALPVTTAGLILVDSIFSASYHSCSLAYTNYTAIPGEVGEAILILSNETDEVETEIVETSEGTLAIYYDSSEENLSCTFNGTTLTDDVSESSMNEYVLAMQTWTSNITQSNVTFDNFIYWFDDGYLNDFFENFTSVSQSFFSNSTTYGIISLEEDGVLTLGTDVSGEVSVAGALFYPDRLLSGGAFSTTVNLDLDEEPIFSYDGDALFYGYFAGSNTYDPVDIFCSIAYTRVGGETQGPYLFLKNQSGSDSSVNESVDSGDGNLTFSFEPQLNHTTCSFATATNEYSVMMKNSNLRFNNSIVLSTIMTNGSINNASGEFYIDYDNWRFDNMANYLNDFYDDFNSSSVNWSNYFNVLIGDSGVDNSEVYTSGGKLKIQMDADSNYNSSAIYGGPYSLESTEGSYFVSSVWLNFSELEFDSIQNNTLIIAGLGILNSTEDSEASCGLAGLYLEETGYVGPTLLTTGTGSLITQEFPEGINPWGTLYMNYENQTNLSTCMFRSNIGDYVLPITSTALEEDKIGIGMIVGEVGGENLTDLDVLTTWDNWNFSVLGGENVNSFFETFENGFDSSFYSYYNYPQVTLKSYQGDLFVNGSLDEIDGISSASGFPYTLGGVGTNSFIISSYVNLTNSSVTLSENNSYVFAGVSLFDRGENGLGGLLPLCEIYFRNTSESGIESGLVLFNNTWVNDLLPEDSYVTIDSYEGQINLSYVNATSTWNCTFDTGSNVYYVNVTNEDWFNEGASPLVGAGPAIKPSSADFVGDYSSYFDNFSYVVDGFSGFDCFANEECSEGYYCQRGYCVLNYTVPEDPECYVDSDCSTGYICTASVCVLNDTGDGDGDGDGDDGDGCPGCEVVVNPDPDPVTPSVVSIINSERGNLTVVELVDNSTMLFYYKDGKPVLDLDLSGESVGEYLTFDPFYVPDTFYWFLGWALMMFGTLGSMFAEKTHLDEDPSLVLDELKRSVRKVGDVGERIAVVGTVVDYLAKRKNAGMKERVKVIVKSRPTLQKVHVDAAHKKFLFEQLIEGIDAVEIATLVTYEERVKRYNALVDLSDSLDEVWGYKLRNKINIKLNNLHRVLSKK